MMQCESRRAISVATDINSMLKGFALDSPEIQARAKTLDSKVKALRYVAAETLQGVQAIYRNVNLRLGLTFRGGAADVDRAFAEIEGWL
jgi:hypothetical protein